MSENYAVHICRTATCKAMKRTGTSIVEKVIVGGYDDDGNADPSMITFVYKTGFEDKKKGDE